MDGQLNGKGRALIWPGTVCGDSSAVQFGDFPNNCQSQPKPHCPRLLRPILLAKSVKHEGKELAIDAFAGIDKPRIGESYGTWQDLDGAYYISTLDGNDASFEAEYMLTHFFLQTGAKLNSDIYLYGELSLRQLLPDYKMKYDSGLGGYTIDILLKEGYYEYHYLTPPPNVYEIEGNHFETENTYDIIVYYLPFSKINHVAAGYISFRTRKDN